MAKRHRVVILGAGFGGLMTAICLARRVSAEAVDIVLVDRSSDHVYTPWLHKVATDIEKRGSALASFSVRELVRPFEGLRFKQGEVKGVDFASQHVVFSRGDTFFYDTLVIGFGSEVADYGIPGVAKFGHSIKTIGGAVRVRGLLRDMVKEIRRTGHPVDIVIGGGGPIGVELASELGVLVRGLQKIDEIERGLVRIELVDSRACPLAGCSAKIQRWTRERLQDLGVTIRSHSSIVKVGKRFVDVTSKKRSSRGVDRLSCDLFLWAGGVQPSRVSRGLNVSADARGRIQVEETLLIRGYDNVYALGDAIGLVDERTGKMAPALAQVAEYEGRVVAANIARQFVGKELRSIRLPRRWSVVIPVGGKYGVAQLGPWFLRGWKCYALRRVVDLKYLLSIMPFWAAFKAWRKWN